MGLVLLTGLAGCSGADGAATGSDDDAPASDGRLFTRLPSRYTGVRFENRVEDTRELNVFTYRNFYNGGGVAIGDLTGDGLPEIMLTSNLGGSRLYLNLGGFRFRDVTDAAGVAGPDAWATGVTFADVDGDGRLDIYVCRAGRVSERERANELFIHQGVDADGVPVFREMAREYGVGDTGYSTHAAFLDYDRDGRLDLYVVNNSPRPVTSFSPALNTRDRRSRDGGDRLYRNEGDRFRDVSAEAGIYGGEAAFGLGVAAGDLNRDGWPDLYVSNDFFERDYLYLNAGDGTFREVLEAEMPSISYASMGLDMADIDNDGWLDLYVTDMLPADERRLKRVTSFESWETSRANVKHGYHHQFTRNVLQRNNGDGTFSEIGQLAGVARTDWSWSALIADFDLDGNKDLYVTNGIPRDITSQDYITYLARDETRRAAAESEHVDFVGLVEATTSTPVPNHAFRNRGDLTFSDESAAWGLDQLGFSNGAAYGDLDGDGALDLVVSSINEEVAIYRNNARTRSGAGFLQVALEGDGANPFGVGSRVTVAGGGRTFVQELMPSRGFQSSVDYVLTFGLGALESVDSVTVEWPDGRVGRIADVPVDERVVVRQAEAADSARAAVPAAPEPLLRDVTDAVALPFRHEENAFHDFRRQPLTPKLLSTDGPRIAVGDVDGDGLDDLFIGGARDHPGRLLRQRPDGSFVPSQDELFEDDRVSEDIGAAFFDADGDGSPDLYVVSGGSEFSDVAPAFRDRLYLNDGRGRFARADGHLPDLKISGSVAAPADFDGDGDLDLFVGGRGLPWGYGIAPRSVLLENDGAGRFTDVTERLAPDLARVGMVNDALWTDLDRDGRDELVVVGDWMPVTVFRNTGSGLEPMAVRGLEKSHGWWNRVVAGDFTGDGRTDLVVGNLGLNSRLHASADRPATLHVGDLDGNGYPEPILGLYDGDVSRPLALLEDLLRAAPGLRSRYPSYAAYAEETVSGLVDAARGSVETRTAYTFASALLRGDGDGGFTAVPLPVQAQVAPLHAILARDLDGDGRTELLLAGNFDGFKPEIGRMAASYGVMLRPDGEGALTVVTASESGFHVPGEARDIRAVRTAHGEIYVVARNDDAPLVFRRGAGAVALATHRDGAVGNGSP